MAHPFFLHGTAIISKIHDPAAAPYLKRYLDVPSLRVYALEGFKASTALQPPGKRETLTKDGVVEILFPRVGLGARHTEWLRLLASLPAQDAMDLIPRVYVWPVAVDDVWSTAGYTPEDLSNIRAFLKVLAESGRQDVFDRLNLEGWGLENRIHQGRYEAFSYQSMGQVARAAAVTKELEQDGALLTDIKKSLLQLARTLHINTIPWTTSEWVFSMGDPKNFNRVLRFKLLSLSPGATVTLIDRKTKKAFADESGITWDHRHLEVNRGTDFPFEETYSVKCRQWLHLKMIVESGGHSMTVEEADTTKDEPKFAL